MKNRVPAKRVEKISMGGGRERERERDGGRDREREGVDEAHPAEKKRAKKEKPERGGQGEIKRQTCL